MELSDVPRGLPLVAGLTGFADAGGAVSQVNKYVFETLETQRVGTFANDLLITTAPDGPSSISRKHP